MFTVEQAAKRAGVHAETIRRWIRQGKLAASLPSRKKGYLIREEALEQFLKEKTKEVQPGFVNAEKVLSLLAKAWEKTQDNSYCDIAYKIAEMSGLLEKYRRHWKSWDGNLADPDFDTKELEERRLSVKYN